MTHALLPDFSRLTLSTGARDSVRDEIMADRTAQLLQAPNGLIERAIVQLGDTDNLDSLRSAAAAAQRYKALLDALRNRDFSLLMTAAWQASARRYAAFLQAALEALVDLDDALQADMYDTRIATIDGQQYLDRRAVLEAILTADENTPWETYGARVPLGRDGYNAHKEKLRVAMATIRRTFALLATRPDTTQEQERELWRTDLLEVMRQAQLTRTTGEVDVVQALVDRQRAREGGGGGGGSSAAYRSHYDMPIPELTPHMQLIFDLIMKEVYDIKEMIFRNGMGPGQYVEETVDFGAFGLGRAHIKVMTTPPHQTYYINWYRANSQERVPIQRILGTESKNASRVKSQADLKRWLNWLDQNELDDRARRVAARTWTRNPPITPRVVGRGS